MSNQFKVLNSHKKGNGQILENGVVVGKFSIHPHGTKIHFLSEASCSRFSSISDTLSSIEVIEALGGIIKSHHCASVTTPK